MSAVIKYVQFIHPVSLGGDVGSINAWSHDKHQHQVDIEEKGNWIILFDKRAVDENGVRQYIRTGRRRRVPITSVAYISDEIEQPVEAPSVTKRNTERAALKEANSVEA